MQYYPAGQLLYHFSGFRKGITVLFLNILINLPERSCNLVEQKRLQLSHDKVIGGVCGGIAEFFNIDPTLVRLVWALLTLIWPIGLLLYLAAMFIIPATTHRSGDSKAGGSESDPQSSRNRTFGLVLLIFGAVMLLHKLIPIISWQIIWSIVFIVVGLLLIIRSD
ncbi:MAG: PspC domain-containing protein [Firmicutes bacterium]|jgi:phage shock protein C|nr:PspC domain-containing protein [Bacillota bacterium]